MTERPHDLLIELYNTFNTHFNMDELRHLTFFLGIDDENIKGSTKSVYARNLADDLWRLNLLPKLEEVGTIQFPHVDWQRILAYYVPAANDNTTETPDLDHKIPTVDSGATETLDPSREVAPADLNHFVRILVGYPMFQTTTPQAVIVVLLVALLAGIGAAVGMILYDPAAIGGVEGALGEATLPLMSPVGGFITSFIGVIVSWLVWSALTYLIGTKLFNGTATMSEMLRVIGFAQAPRLLSVFSFIPCLGGLLSLAGLVWALVASFIGIREGLDLDSSKTLLTIVVSFIGAIAVSFLVGLLLAPIFAIAS